MWKKSERKPQHCDCLNTCGDDPWLEKGLAYPCESMKKRLDEEARERDQRADHVLKVQRYEWIREHQGMTPEEYDQAVDKAMKSSK